MESIGGYKSPTYANRDSSGTLGSICEKSGLINKYVLWGSNQCWYAFTRNFGFDMSQFIVHLGQLRLGLSQFWFGLIRFKKGTGMF